MFNGILWILKTGALWRDLLKEFGPWQTVYKRFAKWTRISAWKDFFDGLVKDVDKESNMVDGSYVSLAPA